MTINVYHHFPDKGKDELMVKIFETLNLLKSKIEIMGQKLDEILAQVSGINDATNNIAADLERLAEQITGGLTSAEADSVVAGLTAAADKLKAIADINPEPPTP